jgi:hypothetical protein
MQQNITLSTLTAAIALTISPAAFAQTLLVHVVQRQNTKTELSAVIPDRADAKADTNSTAAKKPSGSDKSTATTGKGGQTRSYTVTGATLTLQLPDRRLVREQIRAALRLHQPPQLPNTAGR